MEAEMFDVVYIRVVDEPVVIIRSTVEPVCIIRGDAK